MKCMNCNNELPDNSIACNYCGMNFKQIQYAPNNSGQANANAPGYQQGAAQQPFNQPFNQPYMQQPVQTSKKKGKWVKIIVGIAAAIFVICLLMGAAAPLLIRLVRSEKEVKKRKALIKI